MTDDKITIVDLRKAISKQMSLPEETANRFLAALFPTIIEGLKQDKSVKINGLGSFKLVWVAPRKSVNIQTGESIVLEGYNKLTLIPESYIREQINEPFSDMESVLVDANGQPLAPQSTLPGVDPRERFKQQANEIIGLLADLGQQTVEAPQKAMQEEVPEPTDEHVSPVEPEHPKRSTVPETQEPQPVQAPEPEPTQVEQKKSNEQEERPRRFRPWLVALVTILVLLVMLVISYFVLVEKLEDWANGLTSKQTEPEMVILPTEDIEMLDLELLLPMDSPRVDTVINIDSIVTPAPLSLNGERTYDTFFAIETVQPGSRLAQIARRYYGNKDLWVFIYEANKEEIDNPSHLKAGTRLRIPKLPDELKDPNNPEAAALIKRLQQEYSR